MSSSIHDDPDFHWQCTKEDPSMLPAFKHKKSPVFTPGRFQHLAFGGLVAFGAGLASLWTGSQFSYGAAVGLFCTFVFGLVWELATPYLAKSWFRSWTHPFGDVLDFVFYVVGALLIALITSIAGV